MYQIGEFSHLCNITIKTLRHYDKIDLLKPSYVDEYSGYRYYDEKQINKILEIKKLQKAGFKLNEIKQIMKEKDINLISRKLDDLENEYNEKFDILEEKKKIMKNENVEFIRAKKMYFAGYFKKIKNRGGIEKIKSKYFNGELLCNLNDVFISYEKFFEEKDIRCFVGKVIDINNSELVDYCKKNKMSIIDLCDNEKIKNLIHIKTENLENGYRDITRYVVSNNIKIRGGHVEISSDKKFDIYIEAYDLTKENENFIEYNKFILNKLDKICIHDKKYVGKWILQGEINEVPALFDYKDKHYIPDIIYKVLELNEDGTTNLKNVTWNDRYLIMEEDNFKYVSNLYEPEKQINKTYMRLHLNGKESNDPGELYYYKKIK